MFVLDNVSCADTPPTDGQGGGAQIIAVGGSSGGYFSIANNNVFCQLAYGQRGMLEWTPPFPVTVGNGILAAGTRGIRFWNYTAGSVATVSAALSEPAEPPVQLAAGGVATPVTTAALTLIQDQTLLVDSASMIFSGIPQTFKHLYAAVFVGSQAAGNADILCVRFNAQTGAIYDVWGWDQTDAASGAYGGAGAALFQFAACSAAARSGFQFNSGELLIPNYTTTNWKQAQGKGGTYVGIGTMRLDGHCNFQGGSAITRLDFLLSSGGNLRAGSRITLWGMQ